MPRSTPLRDLIDGHLVPDAAPPTDLSCLAGSVRIGRRVDVARDRDAIVGEVLADLRRR